MSGTTDDSLWYRIRYTPIRDGLRGRMTARLDLRRPLETSALAAQMKEMLLRVVKATRLWRLEQIEVMEELIAHFTDGMAAGASAEELVSAFGDEHRAAKLIRRAKRRNRPLAWHALRFVAWSMGGLLVLYSAYAAFFFTGRPSPRINYVDVINKPIEDTPVQNRAWTYYRRALIRIGMSERQSLDVSTGKTPNDRDLSGFARSHQTEIEWIRQGSQKSEFGWVIGAKGSANDPELWPDRSHTLDPDLRPDRYETPANSAGEPLSAATVPSLIAIRELATMLHADEIDAGNTGDGKRLLQDIYSTLSMSRQVGGSSPILLNLISMSLSENALQDIERVLREHPTLIEKQDWLDLIHRLSEPKVAADLFTFQSEQMNFDDILQRAFTDDGSGNGRFTAEGLKFILNPQQVRSRFVETAISPAAGLLVPSRRKLQEEYTAAMTRADSNLKRSLRNADWNDVQKTYSLSRFWISTVMPSYSHTQAAAERLLGHRDGVVTGIALELYRREHNSYPDNLNALVPKLLTEVPVDRITGAPVRYLLKSGQPLIYSVGADLKDDNGWYAFSPAGSAVWNSIDHSEIHGRRSEGDWVLYPTLAK